MTGIFKRFSLARPIAAAHLSAAMLAVCAAAVSVARADPNVDMTTVSSIDARVPAAIDGATSKSVRYRPHRTPLRDDSLAISVFEADSGTETKLELPGLEAISFNMICLGEDGSRTACGPRARVQTINLIARQPITCVFRTTGSLGASLAACDVGGQDLAAWLVRNGVAKPLDSRAFINEEADARKTRSGMWADDAIRRTAILAKN